MNISKCDYCKKCTKNIKYIGYSMRLCNLCENAYYFRCLDNSALWKSRYNLNM